MQYILKTQNDIILIDIFSIPRRAYKPANQYMDFFVSPLAAVTARFVTFIAGSILGVLILLSGKKKSMLQMQTALEQN